MRHRPSPEQYQAVRASVLGYNDAALTMAKERIAVELDKDSSDLDALLASSFGAERCAACGHWFDQAECDSDDRRGGFECGGCAADNN